MTRRSMWHKSAKAHNCNALFCRCCWFSWLKVVVGLLLQLGFCFWGEGRARAFTAHTQLPHRIIVSWGTAALGSCSYSCACMRLPAFSARIWQPSVPTYACKATSKVLSMPAACVPLFVVKARGSVGALYVMVNLQTNLLSSRAGTYAAARALETAASPAGPKWFTRPQSSGQCRVVALQPAVPKQLLQKQGSCCCRAVCPFAVALPTCGAYARQHPAVESCWVHEPRELIDLVNRSTPLRLIAEGLFRVLPHAAAVHRGMQLHRGPGSGEASTALRLN